MGTVMEELTIEEAPPPPPLPPPPKTSNSERRPSSEGYYYVSKIQLVYFSWIILAVLAVVAIATWQVSKFEYSQSQENGKDGQKDDYKYFEDSHLQQQQTSSEQNPVDIRLPRNLLPVYYKLDLIPRLEPETNFSFEGEIWIDVNCTQETDRIVLHAKTLSIDNQSITVTEIASAELPVNRVPEKVYNITVGKTSYCEVRNFYTIEVSPPLGRNKTYRIYMEYRGTIEKGMSGFYRTSYVDKVTNQTRYIALTQFMPTDARKAFPCFDEPDLKASFEISIARRANMSSISNMDLVKSESFFYEVDQVWMWDRFNKSVPMSTYLVAWVVSDFDNKTSDSGLSTPEVKIWARKDIIHLMEYARDIAPRILTFLETYFEVPFPLNKLDLVAIPDFHQGAMENWGATVYKESSLVFDQSKSSDNDKLSVAQLVSHEISHQWFGNLITPEWWNDTWLNEGFAIYMEYIGANHVNPERKPLEQFVTAKLHKALKQDALDSTHAIIKPGSNPNDIDQIFDCSSFGKSASIIRMMINSITETTFKRGLHHCIKWGTYKSLTSDVFWTGLGNMSVIDGTLSYKLSLSEIMNTWTQQKGYPLITVTRNYENNFVTFSQQKFQIFPNANKTQEYSSYGWWVPINFASKVDNSLFQNTEPILWLSPNKSSLTSNKAENVDRNSWLIVNVQQTGYYRVNYDAKNWKLLTEQLWSSYNTIHAINRAQLLDDAYNLAKAELLSYDTVLNLTLYLREETEYLPWQAFSQTVDYVVHMLSRVPIYGQLQEFLQDLIEKQYNRVGFVESSPETELMRQLRVVLVKLACMMEHKDCIDRSVQEFARWMRKADPDRLNPISPNHRPTIYCTAIRNGGQKEWEFLWERFQKGGLATHKAVMLSALGCSKETWILNRLLNWTITENSGIKKMDAPNVFTSMFAQDAGSTAALNFILEKWLDIAKFFGLNNHGIAFVVKGIDTKLSTNLELIALERFRSQHHKELGAAARVIDQAIEIVRANVYWLEGNQKRIALWLETNDEENENEE